MYQYDHKVRQNYIDLSQKKLKRNDMTGNHETAWLLLKDTLLHITWTEDSWINYSILDRDDPDDPFQYSEQIMMV